MHLKVENLCDDGVMLYVEVDSYICTINGLLPVSALLIKCKMQYRIQVGFKGCSYLRIIVRLLFKIGANMTITVLLIF